MSSQLALLLAVVLLAANAFFVGAEFSIISARRSSIEPLALAGNVRARTVLWAMEHVSLMLACAQLGITVCSTSLGVVAEPAIANLIHDPLVALGVSSDLAHPIAFVVALALVVYLHVVLGEMVPKNLAVAGPERAVMWFGPPLVVIARAVAPVIGVLNWTANHVLRLFGVVPRDELASAFTAQEVQSIVEQSQAEGLLDDAQGLLAGAIEFSDRTARDVMVPVGRLITVPATATPDEVERLVARTGYSRFPVLEDADSIELAGYLHLKDVLYADAAARSVPVPAWRIRAFATVTPEAEVEDALVAMQASGAHLARVQEGERCVGVVFLEDILEELVGEVRDAMQRGQFP
ncbi:hemolysin family protein [Pengzhenrongella sicca]|uniref:HlyC/CorC family transporter n=1 Tax=Pengzhenrongella sicca TaxID=2819238 RepID=A0A8A4ZEI5_9MICO|nr:hemolysin family protein [Pengzhenrongella sicca]QTE30314.1 HlyC/CorC family transporter [Pengzhenrongella sicca]